MIAFKQAPHTVLIAESVLRPDAARAVGTVHRVDKPVLARLIASGALDVGIAQQARRHARPDGKDDKSNEVANGHGAAASFVETGTCGAAFNFAIVLARLALVKAVAGRGEVVEPDQEENGARNVDKRVDAVDPCQGGRVLEEKVLDGQLVKDVELLLEVDKLQGMLAGHVNGAFDQSDGSKGTTELVDLLIDVKTSLGSRGGEGS